MQSLLTIRHTHNQTTKQTTTTNTMKFDRLAVHALALLALSHAPFPSTFGTPKTSSSLFALADDSADAAEAASNDDEKTTPTIPDKKDDFVLPETAEKFEFEAEVSRMLDIVVNSLYQNKDVFLRELISNASDALDKVRFLSLTKPEYLKSEEKLQVQIEFDSEANTLTVRDTGIGMTKEDMVSNLGTVARSGTTRFLDALKDQGSKDAPSDISQIGQFGVGFYSAFLVADRVQVASKHPDADIQHVWTSTNGASEFQLYPDPRGNTLTRGTEITLFLKEDATTYAEQYKLEGMAKHYSEFVQHPIYLRTIQTVQVEVEDDEEDKATDDEPTDKSGEEDDLEVSDEESETKKPKEMKDVTTFEWEHLNGSPALWTRSKEDITDEEYSNFYSTIALDDQHPPERWTHFNAEGNINFKSILFLPQDVPLAWKSGIANDGPRGLSLYVQKVLISDTFELLPKYLGFMKGVVDSDDLPLNVNRETLQESAIIQIIRKKVVRKALDLLRQFVKESEQDDEDEKKDDDAPKINKYNDWYVNFAASLKMGCIEDEPNRGKLLKLLRYKSTTVNSDPRDWTSLETYVENMKEWQKDIYFVAGADQKTVEKSTFLEPFLAKGVEVLYFTDPIDEYVSGQVRSFDGHRFVNIGQDGVKLDDAEDKDLATRREKYYKEKFKPLTKWLKKLYGQSVMRVAISNRLVSAPAIASSAEFGHSANMERIMRAQAYSHGQDDIGMMSMKVFEINPRHPFITKLLDGCPPDDDSSDDFTVNPDVENAAWILHEMALLNGGFPLANPEAHSKRMMKFMQSQLGVESTALEDEPDLSVVEEEAPEVDLDLGVDVDEVDVDEVDLDDDDGPKGTSPEDAIPLEVGEDGKIEL